MFVYTLRVREKKKRREFTLNTKLIKTFCVYNRSNSSYENKKYIIKTKQTLYLQN